MMVVKLIITNMCGNYPQIEAVAKVKRILLFVGRPTLAVGM